MSQDDRNKWGAVPLFYADQPAALAIGPNVSRLTLGLVEEDGSDHPRPVVTIAMPTANLLLMVTDLAKTFDNPQFRKNASEGLREAAELLAAGTKHSKESRYTSIAKKVSRAKALGSQNEQS